MGLGLNVSSQHLILLSFALLVEVRKAPIVHVFHKHLSLNPSEFPNLLAGAWGYIQVVLGQSTQEYGFELALGKAEKQTSDYFLELNFLLSARNPDWKKRGCLWLGDRILHWFPLFRGQFCDYEIWNIGEGGTFPLEYKCLVTSSVRGHSQISDMQPPTALDILFQFGPRAMGLTGSVL